MKKIHVATFQGNAIYDDVAKTLKIIEGTLRKVEKEAVDIICFPECYLQGYILDESKASASSCQVPNFLDSYPLSFFRRYHFEN